MGELPVTIEKMQERDIYGISPFLNPRLSYYQLKLLERIGIK